MFFKKFLSSFLILGFAFFNVIPAFAKETSCLLSLKKTNIEQVKNIVDFYARQNNMPEVTGDSDYTYVLVSSQKDDFWVALYEKDLDNVYFYLYSPSEKLNIIKDLQTRFKKNNLKYSTVRSSALLRLKKQDADLIINKKNEISKVINESQNSVTTTKNTNGVIGIYDFSDEAQARFDAEMKNNFVGNNSQIYNKRDYYRVENVSKSQQKQNSEIIKQGSVSLNQTNPVQGNVLPSGITLLVLLQSDISTSSLGAQDRLSAILRDDVKIGDVTIPSGSLVYGSATQTEKAGGAYKDGTLTIKFDKILTLDGAEYSFSSKPIVFKNTNSGMSRTAKVSGRVVAATLAGIALAALTGAISSTDNWGSTLAIGAATGAVSGGLSLVGANGEDIEVKQGAVLTVVTE